MILLVATTRNFIVWSLLGTTIHTVLAVAMEDDRGCMDLMNTIVVLVLLALASYEAPGTCSSTLSTDCDKNNSIKNESTTVELELKEFSSTVVAIASF